LTTEHLCPIILPPDVPDLERSDKVANDTALSDDCSRRGRGRPKGTTRVDPAGLEWVHKNPNQLNSTERMVLFMQLAGMRHREIAERLGRNEQHISRITRYRR